MNPNIDTPTTPDGNIITVGKLLIMKLLIPQYQRPYKWTTNHVGQLFSDIAAFKDISSYRLGTIVFHLDGGMFNIVDGQQRTLTLLLAAHALINYRKHRLERNDLKKQLDDLKCRMINPKFTNKDSQFNIRNNYIEISRIITRSDFTEDHIDFLLNRCEVVTFSLKDVSEAFQFFDSQNSRGLDLEPHDLLKAYHLREFSLVDSSIKAKTVKNWENIETQELANLFSQYLYRIRNWTIGESARYFSKNDTNLFKGVNLANISSYPYIAHLRIAHHFVDNYNNNYQRKIDGSTMEFPFHLDQIIINGRRFFEMIAYYQKRVERIDNVKQMSEHLSLNMNGYAEKILQTIDSYDGRNRKGDSYVRSIFDCLLIYYIDKFGFAELSRAIEKVFVWAYSLRLRMQVVQLASMDNYVLENNMFKLIKESIHPTDFINYSLPIVTNNRSPQKTKKIEDLFKEMKYYE